jgi:hypothetical protein
MIDAHTEASQRHQVSRLAGVTNQVVADGNPISVDFIGLLGEIGFAIIFSQDRDKTVSARSGSVDFNFNGLNFEIKSSKYKNAHLLVPAYVIDGKTTVKEHCHVYCLMIVNIDERHVTFAGWTERKNIIDESRLEYFRGSSRQSFVLSQDKLEQLDDLTAHWLVVMIKSKGHRVELTEAE